MTQCLSELSEFKKKETKSIKAYYDQFNDLIYKYSRYNVVHFVLELNITFIQGLRKEWKNICLMIKTQESFHSYYLINLYKIFNAHEAKVKEITDEKDKENSGSPLVLVSKININKARTDVEDDDNEEGLIVNFDDEAISYYFNNNIKKF